MKQDVGAWLRTGVAHRYNVNGASQKLGVLEGSHSLLSVLLGRKVHKRSPKHPRFINK